MRFENIKLYPDREDVTLRAYLISDSPELLNGKPRPSVLICPGGAYVNLCEREAEPVALRFAAMGYHAFVLNYSVVTKEINPFGKKLEFDEKTLFPAQIRDVGKAFLIIREHANEWFVNPEQIVLCGFSAGGHNCAMYSVYWDKPILTDFLGVDAELLRPAAAILSYPVVDYKLWQTQAIQPWQRELDEISNLSFLGVKTVDEELARKVSPNHLVSESTPPMFLWATREDNVVSIQHTILLANAMAAAGRPFELHIFENGPHGLSLATEASAEARDQIYTDVAGWVAMAEGWLRKRFPLELKETGMWG